MGNHVTPTPRQNGGSSRGGGPFTQQLYEDMEACNLGPHATTNQVCALKDWMTFSINLWRLHAFVIVLMG